MGLHVHAYRVPGSFSYLAKAGMAGQELADLMCTTDPFLYRCGTMQTNWQNDRRHQGLKK